MKYLTHPHLKLNPSFAQTPPFLHGWGSQGVRSENLSRGLFAIFHYMYFKLTNVCFSNKFTPRALAFFAIGSNPPRGAVTSPENKKTNRRVARHDVLRRETPPCTFMRWVPGWDLSQISRWVHGTSKSPTPTTQDWSRARACAKLAIVIRTPSIQIESGSDLRADICHKSFWPEKNEIAIVAYMLVPNCVQVPLLSHGFGVHRLSAARNTEQKLGLVNDNFARSPDCCSPQVYVLFVLSPQAGQPGAAIFLHVEDSPQVTSFQHVARHEFHASLIPLNTDPSFGRWAAPSPVCTRTRTRRTAPLADTPRRADTASTGRGPEL